MDHLTGQVKEIVKSYGPAIMGIATRQTLQGGPPSADLTYVLPEAKSAISFAIPLNKDFIRPFLAKEAEAYIMGLDGERRSLYIS